MNPETLAQLRSEKHISLETFKRDGTGVRTPVWFGEENGTLYLYTLPDAWKVKRLRANPRVRFAACNMRGTEIRGAWFEGLAHLADENETRTGQTLLKKKYWPWKSIGDFFSRLRGRQQVVLVIRCGAV